MGQATTAANSSHVANILQGFIPADRHIHQMNGGGMYREGYQSYQPLVAFHILAFGGHNCGLQQGPLTPPPVRAV